MSMPPTIRIADVNGADVLRYLKLPDHMFFGGTVNGLRALDNGPHVFHQASSMMALFARLANADVEYPYVAEASDVPARLILKPDGLSAADIAAVLGIGPQEVADYYGLAVRLTESA